MTPITLAQAQVESDFAAAHSLFLEYAQQLGVSLCFQGFAEELETLDQMYGPPHGCLMLARHGDEHIGCIGVRRIDAQVCEMKRLYVRDVARGSGTGRRLAQAAIEAGRGLGYRKMVLDTLGDMAAARNLYATLGFRQIRPYYENPLPGVTYMELDL
ncbi:MAG TPA: GNAT family N-acetyltransferase [Burkholderiaceae bacterium]|jgi:GNAT superfamily N-acetyltransferase|nr:GNAT family N-acetyltransferase [Burkholderiaceae bacterium]